MQYSPPTVPPFIQENLDEDCLHVFLIQNPLAIIMSLMIADAYHISPDRTYAVRIRNMDTEFTNFKTLALKPCSYDRYVNRLTGRHLGAFRLRRQLEKLAKRYIIYASWQYPEMEELISSSQCVGHVIFEEGQQTYRPSKPYARHWRNRWLFRRKKISQGSIHYYFREDSACHIGLSPEAFPFIAESKRYVLTNMANVAKPYKKRLEGVESIGLMPAPTRLSPESVMPAIDRLIGAVEGRAVIKMHPGFLSEKTYCPQDFSRYIHSASGGRVSLCPDDALIELEMLSEKKKVYGAPTSLSRYAEMLGSEFHFIAFSNYTLPNINKE
jgi:hypothetical protein